MPLLFIRARGAEYCALDDGSEYDHPEAALAAGVQSAVSMAADDIGRGGQSAAVEVTVEREDGTRLLSCVVAICVSPLVAATEPNLVDAA